MKKGVVKNQEELQKYISTTVEHDLNVCEKIVIDKLVEIAQKELLDEQLEGVSILLIANGDKRVTVPLREFMKNEIDSKSRLLKTIISLTDWDISYETEGEWKPLRLIDRPSVGATDVTIEMHKEIWKALASFKK
jgi:hypothetical protein